MLKTSKMLKNNHVLVRVKAIITMGITALLTTCQPSYAIASTNQKINNHSFNYVDMVAMTGNNGRQEPRKLLNTVQYHHTLVDVFLCLSFANSLFMGELRLAALWWGVHGNKPFTRRIPCAVCLRFSSLPAALIFGRIIKKLLPLEKV
ncbi:MAG: hypothetical protein KDI39_00875 [Pseudomonadales bacterium]|nr:hypothetical protein [Pseudomonadales bacterium]